MHLIQSDLAGLPLLDSWFEDDPEVRAKVAFPMFAATGSEHSAVVYFELEPGYALGTHTDSAEEVVLVIDGEVQATVGDEVGTLSRGGLLLIPAMMPHNVRNVGSETAKCVGFFASATVVSTFERPLSPLGTTVAGTPPIPQSETPVTWSEVMAMLAGSPADLSAG